MSTAPDIARLSLSGAVVAHCRLPAWEAEDYVSRSSPSSVGLSFTRQACVVEAGGRGVSREVEADSVVVTGGEATDWLQVAQPCEIIEISGDAGLRSEIAEELGVAGAFDLGAVQYAGGPIGWALAARLRALVRCRGAADTIEAESLVRRFYGEVFISRFGGRLRERGNGALDARRLSRVADYIDSHLGGALNLTILSEVAALSPFHFQRSFRRATGCSPHRYVALRRADRARRALAAGCSHEEIASSLGYYSRRRLRAAVSEA